MSEALSRRIERRSRQRAANRGAILEAARRVAAREGAGELSLRAVAGEAGYAPASVYEYFRNRAELVLALAAEDMGSLARAVRESAVGREGGAGAFAAAAKAALDIMRVSGALSAATATLEGADAPPEAERLFNGKLIAALTAFAEATGRGTLRTRDEQGDVVLAAAAVTGLAVLARAGRLKSLGLDEGALLDRLEKRFTPLS
jgi:AcrR family transcriptional regulator